MNPYNLLQQFFSGWDAEDFEMPAEDIVITGSFEKIRRAETPADYFATFSELPIYDRLIAETR